MKIVGYSDRWSVQPGEKVRFMVSTELSGYRADIVRLIHGDDTPGGPGFKDEPLETSVSGEYPGRQQPIRKGSYVTVPDSPALRLSGSFTLQAWIYPTTPKKGVQGVLTKWDPDGGGYGLFIDETGGAALWLSDDAGDVRRVGTGVPLNSLRWHFVAATYDSESGSVSVRQEPVEMWPRDESRSTASGSTGGLRPGSNTLPLLMAGHWGREESGEHVVVGHFNGKIGNPSVFRRALGAGELEALRRGAPHGAADDSLAAAWDFGRDFSTDRVTDASSNGLDGRAVNMPARAMTGHNWRGSETDFRQVPDEYAAIYFHDDDLDDAGWDVDFELTVPDGLRSGVYAAHVRSGDDEDYIPFFVRPKRGTSSAPILFLAPTASYLAYANAHARSHWKNQEMFQRLYGDKGAPVVLPSSPQDIYARDQNLLSLYDRHTDGSGVCYSSRLRPVVSMRPKYVMESLGLGKGGAHQFNADLHLLDWMETKGYNFDVVTDEDLHAEGQSLLEPYLCVVTGSHPEYWSSQMLDALEGYLSEGGRLMYLGGNGFYWVTSFDPERPHMIEIRRWRGTELWEADPGEYHHSTTGEVGGLWRFRGRPPQKLTGVGFSAQGTDYGIPYERNADSRDPRAAFIFEGIGEDEVIGDFGLVMGGAAGFEVDRADYELGTPPHALVMATATGFSDVYQHVVEEVLLSDSRQGGTVNPMVKGDMVYFEGPKGGGVFSVGSITWCGSLSHNDYDNNVSRITDNVLRRFSSEDPIE